VAGLHRALPQTRVLVTEPDFDVPIWKLDRSKAFIYILPTSWRAENRGLPHDVIMLPGADGARRNIVITEQVGDSSLEDLKVRYERDLPKALKDFKLESSEWVPAAAGKLVRIIHTNTTPGVAVRQVNYLVPVGDKRYFVAATVLEDDKDTYDKQFQEFVESMAPPDDAP
jgi:hypothetical protein